MNMTAELVQRMKAAAQEATQGEWRWEGDGGFSYLVAEGDTSPENRIIDDGSAWGEYAETISPDSFDAAHIATSCPQNVLALVEALEAAEKRGTDMEVACELFAESKLAQIKLEAALEKAQQRIAELEASHSKLRETLAGIHNTIRTDGSYTPLAAILNAVKRAHEESVAAAGVAVDGE